MHRSRTSLESLRYWRATQHKQAQRFYVALCLAIASLQDGFLGSRERRRGNLNWSATISYYSLVHAARFLLFISLGDFPRSHDRLKRFLEGDSDGSGRYPFDWLTKFSGETAGLVRWSQPDEVFTRPADEPSGWHLLGIVESYLRDLIGPDAPKRLHTFGHIFSRAKGLRNEANYEALLIAHEQQHRITPAFERLAEAMSRAARQIAHPLLAEALLAFIARDSYMSSEQDRYRAFLHDHVRRFVEPELSRKLMPDGGLVLDLRTFLESYRDEGDPVDYQALNFSISEQFFGGKSSLMTRFERSVLGLETVLESEGPPNRPNGGG